MALSPENAATVRRAITLVNADPSSDGLHDHQRLAAAGFALAGMEDIATHSKVRMFCRFLEGLTISPNMPDPVQMIYALGVDQDLFDLAGDTDWEQIRARQNERFGRELLWKSEPLDQGGEHFAHILQGAGDRIHTLFEVVGRVKAQLLAEQLDGSTPAQAIAQRTRRI